MRWKVSVYWCWSGAQFHRGNCKKLKRWVQINYFRNLYRSELSFALSWTEWNLYYFSGEESKINVLFSADCFDRDLENKSNGFSGSFRAVNIFNTLSMLITQAFKPVVKIWLTSMADICVCVKSLYISLSASFNGWLSLSCPCWKCLHHLKINILFKLWNVIFCDFRS